MMHFAFLLSAFWTGTTGKQITVAGKDARIVATYMLSCHHANMIGVYRIPVLYIATETGLKRNEVMGAIDKLNGIGFLKYDQESEFVWVVEMARIQNGLLPGEAMKEEDKRAKGIASQYKHLPSNPFLAPFFDRYHTAIGIAKRFKLSPFTVRRLGYVGKIREFRCGRAVRYDPQEMIDYMASAPDVAGRNSATVSGSRSRPTGAGR